MQVPGQYFKQKHNHSILIIIIINNIFNIRSQRRKQNLAVIQRKLYKAKNVNHEANNSSGKTITEKLKKKRPQQNEIASTIPQTSIHLANKQQTNKQTNASHTDTQKTVLSTALAADGTPHPTGAQRPPLSPTPIS